MWEKFIGPATVVYLISATVAALWWASDLTRQVKTLNDSTVTAERIARLEAETRNLGDSTRELKASVNALVTELKRSP